MRSQIIALTVLAIMLGLPASAEPVALDALVNESRAVVVGRLTEVTKKRVGITSSCSRSFGR